MCSWSIFSLSLSNADRPMTMPLLLSGRFLFLRHRLEHDRHWWDRRRQCLRPKIPGSIESRSVHLQYELHCCIVNCEFSTIAHCQEIYLPGLWLALKICIILSAALTGTVLFSTTILSFCAMRAIIRAALSTYFKSAARPRPLPKVFVGVLTDMNMSSASLMADSMSLEKNKFTFRHRLTTSSRPGCDRQWMHWKINEKRNKWKNIVCIKTETVYHAFQRLQFIFRWFDEIIAKENNT